MSDDDAVPKTWRQHLLIVPGLLIAAIVSAFGTWVFAAAVSGVQSVAPSGTPVSVNVETNPSRIGGFSDLATTMIVPATAEFATGPGQGCEGFHDWARGLGAVDAGVTRLQLVVESRSTGEILLSDMRAVVVEQAAPFRGVAITCPSAGEAQFRNVEIDLDDPNRRAAYSSSTPREFGFTLEQGRTETFLLTASAAEHSYGWHLELDVVADGETHVVRVDDDGKPFSTSPPPKTAVWEWDYSDQWIRSDGENRDVIPVGEPLPAESGS